jgi:hypothetical protein
MSKFISCVAEQAGVIANSFSFGGEIKIARNCVSFPFRCCENLKKYMAIIINYTNKSDTRWSRQYL